jgi:hypothetical protein
VLFKYLTMKCFLQFFFANSILFFVKSAYQLEPQVSVKVDIGFAKEAPVLGIFGMNVYHKNRLIMVITV